MLTVFPLQPQVSSNVVEKCFEISTVGSHANDFVEERLGDAGRTARMFSHVKVCGADVRESSWLQVGSDACCAG